MHDCTLSESSQVQAVSGDQLVGSHSNVDCVSIILQIEFLIFQVLFKSRYVVVDMH